MTTMLFLAAMGLYALAGLLTALVTMGARILLIPAAAALWPYVLYRWRTARPAR